MEIQKNTPYIRSRFLQSVELSGQAVIWHSLFGNPKVVTSTVLLLLQRFSRPCSTAEFYEEYELDEYASRCLTELISEYFLIPVDFDERQLLRQAQAEQEEAISSGSLIDYIELIVSEACNFRCSYCIHFNNLETSDRLSSGKRLMPWAIAQEAVDNFLSILREHSKRLAEVNFGGGESLLNWPLVQRTVSYCISRYGAEFEFKFSINTNLSLLTDAIAAKMIDNHVSVACSLDGLQYANDLVRRTSNGSGTFAKIIRGMGILAQVGYPLDGFALTVNGSNYQFIDEQIIDWAVGRGMREIRIDIDVIGMVEVPVEQIAEKFMRLRQYGAEKGIRIIGFWSRPVENLNDSALTSHLTFCGGLRGNSICVSPSGDLYYCGYSTRRIGRVSDMAEISVGGYQGVINWHLVGRNPMCHGCPIEGQCVGGCGITQEYAAATKSLKVERMCEFYRLMTRLLLEDLLRKEVNAGEEPTAKKETGWFDS